MGMWQFASRRTSKDLVTGDLTLTVANGESIQVCGILLDNETGASIVVNIRNGAGTIIGRVTIPAFETFEIRTHWLADAGLQLRAATGGVFVTVFHNSPGN